MPYTESALYQKYGDYYLRKNSGSPVANFPSMDLNVGNFLPADKKAPILDLGCGMGHLLLFLRDRKYEATEGIDVSEEQISHCRNLGLTGAQQVLDSEKFLNAKQGYYQLILATDVIEHLPKHTLIAMLAAIRGALRPGGLFVMRVPNISAFVGPWVRYRDLTHEISFCEDSAVQAFELAGFSEIRILREQYCYRRKFLGYCFELLRSAFYRVLKTIYFLQLPGSAIPEIYTANLYAIGQNGSQVRS